MDDMNRKPNQPLRSGFTTGACATAASSAACVALLTGEWVDPVRIILPRGQVHEFPLESREFGPGWARASVRKDAGDDPDVTHNALIVATVRLADYGSGFIFRAGNGVGTVTKPGLPIPVGEPAINPVPRKMIIDSLSTIAGASGVSPDFHVEISVPGGEDLALKTWNPRLGITGGISILGTTGIVRPYSCAAWIASIHMGIDVARANGTRHVIGSTGATSEAAAQAHYQLPDWAMLDMGDFAGGLLKYLKRNPVPRLTIAGGFGKLTKLAQGASDLHSARSQVDFSALARLAAEVKPKPSRSLVSQIEGSNTALHALEIGGPMLAGKVARHARASAESILSNAPVKVEVMVFDRAGGLIAQDRSTGF